MNIPKAPTKFEIITVFVGIVIAVAAVAGSFAWASDVRPISHTTGCAAAQQKFLDSPIKASNPYVPVMQQFFEVCK